MISCLFLQITKMPEMNVSNLSSALIAFELFFSQSILGGRIKRSLSHSLRVRG